MNNDNNSFSNGQNVTTVPVVNGNVVPTTPVVNVTTPVVNNVPTTQVIPQTVSYTAPVVNNTQVATIPIVNSVPTTQAVPQTVPYTTPVVAPTTQPPILEPTPIIEPSTEVPTVPAVTPQQPDNNAMINENLRKVEINNYNPPSKLKIIVLLFFFALIIAFIIFLPQISSYIRNYNSGTSYEKEKEEVITTGKLVCNMNTNTLYLDKEFEFDFSFADSKLKRTKYIVYTKGDSTTEALLDETAEKCKLLKEETQELDGVTIKCDYSDGKLSETQIFELEVVDTEKLTAAFTEAGGILPSYKYDQSIDDIETNMKASGYTCERQK